MNAPSTPPALRGSAGKADPADDGASAARADSADSADDGVAGFSTDSADPADSAARARANTIGSLLCRTVSRNGSATALVFEDRHWSYAELGAAVHGVALRLVAAQLRPGDRVAAYGLNSDAYLILYLACASAGLVHVPVNFALKGEELAYLLEDSGAGLLVADDALLPVVDGIRAAGRAPTVDQVWPMFTGTPDGPRPLLDTARRTGTDATEQSTDAPEAEQATESTMPSVSADLPAVNDYDLVQLLYTSGTTAAPKGAMMSHAALVSQYASAITDLDLAGQDRPLIAMPLYHSAAMHVFLMPYLALGATVHLLAKPDVPAILRQVEDERIGSLFLAPTVWLPLANSPELERWDLSSLRKAQYCASIMPVTVLERLRSSYPGIGFYNCFGQSELGPLTTVLRPEEHDARPASCGRPVLNVEARVVASSGKEAGPGEAGEIQYRSPQLFSGYWNKSAETEAVLAGGWFHSGDLVTRDEQGFIQVVDRIKDVINTGGVLVAPREVEDCIYELPDVLEVAVFGLPDERWIESVTAVVVRRDGSALGPDDVINHVKARMAGFKVPKRVEFVAELPRNQSGKLLKRHLRAERSPEPNG